MNIVSKEVLEKFGGSIEQLSAEHISFVAPDGSKVGPVNHPPQDWAQLLDTVRDTDQMLAVTPVQSVNNAVQSFFEYTGGHRAIKSDRHLSEFGRAERTQPLIEKAFSTIGPAVQAMAKHQASLAERSAQRYAVPSEPTPWDVSIFDYVQKLDRAGRSDLERNFMKGQHPQVMEAILRSPLAFTLGDVVEIAEKCWRERIDRADPKGHQVLKAATAYADWAGRVVSVFQSRLVSTTGVNRERLYSLVKPHGAQHWGFDPTEAMAFDNAARYRRH